MTIFSENADQFASRAEDHIVQQRHAGVAEALELIKQGRPGYAHFKMARSVMRQARVAGLGTVPPTTCPCGAACERQERAA